MRKKTIGFNVNFTNEDGFNNERYYAVTYEDSKKKEDHRIEYLLYKCDGRFLGSVTKFDGRPMAEVLDDLRRSARALDTLKNLAGEMDD